MPRGELYGISLRSASPSRGLPPPPKSDRLTSGSFRNSNAKARPLPHRNVRTGRAKAPQNVKEASLELSGYTKDSINQARPGIKQRGSFSLLGSITGATKVAVHGPFVQCGTTVHGVENAPQTSIFAGGGRIFPLGDETEPNEEGLAFYDRVLDELETPVAPRSSRTASTKAAG